ncbi:unnamed protein product, partial [Nesidiocoris tenuis]
MIVTIGHGVVGAEPNQCSIGFPSHFPVFILTLTARNRIVTVRKWIRRQDGSAVDPPVIRRVVQINDLQLLIIQLFLHSVHLALYLARCRRFDQYESSVLNFEFTSNSLLQNRIDSKGLGIMYQKLLTLVLNLSLKMARHAWVTRKKYRLEQRRVVGSRKILYRMSGLFHGKVTTPKRRRTRCNRDFRRRSLLKKSASRLVCAGGVHGAIRFRSRPWKNKRIEANLPEYLDQCDSGHKAKSIKYVSELSAFQPDTEQMFSDCDHANYMMVGILSGLGHERNARKQHIPDNRPNQYSSCPTKHKHDRVTNGTILRNAWNNVVGHVKLFSHVH